MSLATLLNAKANPLVCAVLSVQPRLRVFPFFFFPVCYSFGGLWTEPHPSFTVNSRTTVQLAPSLFKNGEHIKIGGLTAVIFTHFSVLFALFFALPSARLDPATYTPQWRKTPAPPTVTGVPTPPQTVGKAASMPAKVDPLGQRYEVGGRG